MEKRAENTKEHIYKIQGMTCEGCATSVVRYLKEVPQVVDATVYLKKEEAALIMDAPVEIQILQEALPEKYNISEGRPKGVSQESTVLQKNKLQQLRPLLLILFYITCTSVLLHYDTWDFDQVMLDFMGLFYIVFSFFKVLDLKGFPESFRMYDPLAKKIPIYGKYYPFIEIALGLMFLMRFKIEIALVLTIIILGITTIGVVQSLLNKKSIRCACLGTVLKLPMTEATFIENAMMIIMASILLFKFI